MFKIHHLNCATLCPPGGILVNEPKARLVCHCLLIETENSGLVLVDSGFGVEDVLHPENVNVVIRKLIHPSFKIEETAFEQVKALGFDPRDVKHMIVTHLDLDHVGGVFDFPGITLHVMREEFDAASAPRTLKERLRYRSEMASWDVSWKLYETDSEWFGLRSVSRLDGLPEGIRLVSLRGHTRGHAGVAVSQTVEISDGKWILHAGDSYFYFKEMDVNDPRCTIGLELNQLQAEEDKRARLESAESLRELIRKHGDKVQVFCAHDPVEFKTYLR